jgi:type IV pilus assembly protein PilA
MRDANLIDWVIEGSTYGCYQATTNTTGNNLALGAWSNIDGDTINGCVTLYKSSLDSVGVTTGTTPTLPTAANCPGVLAWGAPWGQVRRPNDNAF